MSVEVDYVANLPPKKKKKKKIGPVFEAANS